MNTGTTPSRRHPARPGLVPLLGLAGVLAAACGTKAAAGSVAPATTAAVPAAAVLAPVPTPAAAPRPTRLVVTLGLQGNLEPCGCGGNNAGGLGSLVDEVAAQREAGVHAGLEVHTIEGGASVGTGPLTALAREALLTSWRSQGYDAVCLGHDELAALPTAWPSAPAAEFLVLGHPTRHGTVTHRTLGATMVTSLVVDDDTPGAIAGLRRFVGEARAAARLPVVMLHARGKARMNMLRAMSGLEATFVAFDVLWDGSTGGVSRYGRGLVVRTTRNGKAMALVDTPVGDATEPIVTVVPMSTKDARTRHSLQETAAAAAVATLAPFDGHVGSKRCGECHPAELARWQSTSHAQAMATLERTDTHGRADCYVCHITATLPPANAATIELPANVPEAFHDVGCESCHGPGAQHIAERRPLPRAPLSSCAQCHVAKFSGQFDAARMLARATCQGAPMSAAERDAGPDLSLPQQRGGAAK